MQEGRVKSLCRCDGDIFLASVLVLYLELMLIRWIGTEIRIFAFFGNLILVVCFFGTGLGCYLASKPVAFVRLTVSLMVAAFLVANPFHLRFLDFKGVTDALAGFEDSPLWSGIIKNGPFVTAFGLVALMLYLVLSVFVPAGQLLGRSLQEHPRVIRAYCINIIGSLTGIWLFNGLSWLGTTPIWWFVVMAVLLSMEAWLVGFRIWNLLIALGLTLCFVWIGTRPPRGELVFWSPYQKLSVDPLFFAAGTNQAFVGGIYGIEANGSGYQYILNLSDEFIRTHPGLYNAEQARLSHYNLAFQFKREIHRMLIVGAGAGNNAAAALRHGVEQVDCVEIDPQIYALGKELHPEHPYDSPRVHMYITDARAFLKRATGPYDMIWFALLDAHPGSSFNNRRVDHFVYTVQSFQEARRLLSSDGILLVNFSALRLWIADRLYGILDQVFGHPPMPFYLGAMGNQYGASGELTLVAANKPLTLDCVSAGVERDYLVGHLVSNLTGKTRPTTDDWPYLYLHQAKIPKLYIMTYLILFCIVTLTGRGIWVQMRNADWHFFALGAAFFLLEVQTVSRAMLLFGTMWTVNAIVISAVLLMILLSNLVAARWPKLPQWFIVAGLGVTVVQLALVPLDWFNGLTGATKLVAASAFLTAPVFFAGLIFIRSFATCPDKSRALGSNLIGALVGGLLESLSFVTGIRALVLLVGLFYIVAISLRPVRTPNSLSAVVP